MAFGCRGTKNVYRYRESTGTSSGILVFGGRQLKLRIVPTYSRTPFDNRIAAGLVAIEIV